MNYFQFSAIILVTTSLRKLLLFGRFKRVKAPVFRRQVATLFIYVSQFFTLVQSLHERSLSCHFKRNIFQSVLAAFTYLILCLSLESRKTNNPCPSMPYRSSSVVPPGRENAMCCVEWIANAFVWTVMHCSTSNRVGEYHRSFETAP